MGMPHSQRRVHLLANVVAAVSDMRRFDTYQSLSLPQPSHYSTDGRALLKEMAKSIEDAEAYIKLLEDAIHDNMLNDRINEAWKNREYYNSDQYLIDRDIMRKESAQLGLITKAENKKKAAEAAALKEAARIERKAKAAKKNTHKP